MDSKECLPNSCDKLSTTAPGEQRNLQMCMTILKEETVECIDEEESACSENMCPYKPLDSSNYVNYYDSKICVLDKIKKEFPEDECPQSDNSVNSKTVSKNSEYLKRMNKQGENHENTEDDLPLIINEGNLNKSYRVTIKMERLEEADLLDNAQGTSIHYDVLVTHQEVQCKLCARLFKNSFNLLKHNNAHIKVKINTPGDYSSQVMELHQCQYCDKRFINHDNMLAHIGDVHTKKKANGQLCGKKLKSTPNLKHLALLNKLKEPPNKQTRNIMKCGYCNAEYKYEYSLYKHMKLCCTPKRVEKYKCDTCERVYKTKKVLITHIKKVHYDYGKMFDCWCGQQFRSPIHLSVHKRYRHHPKRKNKLETFECWCGKQYNSWIYFLAHKSRKHDVKIKDTNNDNFECDFCHKVFKRKRYLGRHLKSIHYDYGKVFDCRCGKQFRTPTYLRKHMTQQHGGSIENTKNAIFQCDSCKKFFITKHGLVHHIKNVHYDYGKVFVCWCGKQFYSKLYLSIHKKWQHGGNLKKQTITNFNVTPEIFKTKRINITSLRII